MRKKVTFRGPVKYKILYRYVSLIHRLFYRRFMVVGYEKIPVGTPLIFAPNHQNALMDALAVLFAARKPVVFMARADIFKKPFIAKLLNFLKILPIYRIRDGYGELGRNQEVFETTVEVLNSNTPLCILPEGNHEGLKRLRPLKKGIFRIAFQAEESRLFKLNLHIVPVGIDYSDYYKAGSDLLVVIGSPIRIADYAEQYRENEQKTINTLVNVLSEGIRSVMIDIPEDNYHLIHQISEMYEPNVWNTCKTNRHPYNKHTIRQYIIQKVAKAFARFPEKATETDELLLKYNTKLAKLGIDDCSLVQKQPGFFSLLAETVLSILLLPLHIYGLILNYLPYKIPLWQALKVKDANFRTSIQFGISMVIFPIWYLLLISVFCLTTDGYIVKMIFGLSLPFAGLFTFYNYMHMKMLWKRIHLFRFIHTDRNQYISIMEKRNQIIDLIKNTINS